MMPGSGPYTLNDKRTTQENNGLVVLDRREDYWAVDHKRNTGLNNFDRIEFIFIGDEEGIDMQQNSNIIISHII